MSNNNPKWLRQVLAAKHKQEETERRTARTVLYFYDHEKETLTAAAEQAGMSVSELCRMILVGQGVLDAS